MVVEIGAGTTDVAVIAESRAFRLRYVRTGGNSMDEAIAKYMRRVHNLLIGDRVAEMIKVQIGSAWPLDEKLDMEIKGRNVIAGSVETMKVTDASIREAMGDCVKAVIRAVCDARDRIPPNISAGFVNDLIVLSGGGALVKGIDQAIQDSVGIRVHIPTDPICNVVNGFGPLLDGAWKPAQPLEYPPRRN